MTWSWQALNTAAGSPPASPLPLAVVPSARLFRSGAFAGGSVKARVLASVVGEEGLAETDRKYLRFGTAFEQALASQTEARTLEQSMALGWALLAGLPKSELTRLSDTQIAAHIETLA